MVIKSEIQLKKILPNNRDPKTLLEALNRILPKYDINTVERVSMFLGQCAHESWEFMRLTENLNYTADGLLRVFPSLFNKKTAGAYAHKPAAIANRVYANKLGNGPEASGDGWNYRGHGFLQVTGKDAFIRFANSIEKPLADTMMYVKTLDGALEVSCWYWKNRGLNLDADRLDIITITRKINARSLGLEERRAFTRIALSVLGLNEMPVEKDTLQLNDVGPQVIDLQKKLGLRGFIVAADGVFGIGTENAVKQFQKASGLKVDGVAGPKTRALL